jgi:uncharacterized membrane protein
VNNVILHLCEHKSKIILLRLLFLSFISIWIYGFFLPIITPIDNYISDFLLTRIYSLVCHQESVKCFSIGSATILICARCLGIYVGALIAGLLSLVATLPAINIKVLVLSAIPFVLDVFFTFAGVYAYSKSVAFCTSIAFGSVVYLIILSELENLFWNKLYKGNE